MTDSNIPSEIGFFIFMFVCLMWQSLRLATLLILIKLHIFIV